MDAKGQDATSRRPRRCTLRPAAPVLAAALIAGACTRSPPPDRPEGTDEVATSTPPPVAGPDVALHLYRQPGNELRILEVRPRSRTIAAWRIAVPLEEKDVVVDFRTGPPGTPPAAGEDAGRIAATFTDPTWGELWMLGAETPIGPGRSVYLGLRRRPRTLYLGARGAPFAPLDPGALAR
jgi:hypothetical protein